MTKFRRRLLPLILLLPGALLHSQESVRLSLDATPGAGAAISPLLFGHNLEITRRGAWQGLSAEMIANRKFAAADRDIPRRWTVITNGGRAAIDTRVPYTGRQSVRVDVDQEGKATGIRQAQESLAVQQDVRYVLRLWVKTETNRPVKARLTDPDGKQVFLETEWAAKPGPWQLLTAEFLAPATGLTNRLDIASRIRGSFWIGAVSLRPANNFHGMRRDVVELLRRLKPGSLRFPGGCYAEFYRWQDGLLPVDERPPLGPTRLAFLLPEGDDYDAHEIGTDEFLALCREIGCEPAITVRVSENTPEDAAGWVEYCNGGPGTKWGAIRAARGPKAPLPVKCWFVGNELYAFGRGGLNRPTVAARQTQLFAAAMKQVDPGLRLVGCARHDQPEWNAALIAQAGSQLDLYSVHDYLLDHFQGDLSAIARAPTQVLRPILGRAQAGLRRDLPAGHGFALAFDEWNTRWGQPGSVAMGLYAAGVLNLLCRDAGALQIERACYFMPVNEGAIRVTPLSASLDPAGEVFELYQVHQGNRLLPTPAAAPDADLDLCASATPDGARVYVTVVNRSATRAGRVELAVRGLPSPAPWAQKTLSPATLDATPRSFRLIEEPEQILAGDTLVVKVPPASVSRVRVGRPGHLD